MFENLKFAVLFSSALSIYTQCNLTAHAKSLQQYDEGFTAHAQNFAAVAGRQHLSIELWAGKHSASVAPKPHGYTPAPSSMCTTTVSIARKSS